MRVLVVIVWLLSAKLSLAQGWSYDVADVDWNVSSIRTTAPDSLAFKLTASCKTDLQKVKTIFRWITDNIAYRTRNTSYSFTDYEEPVLDTAVSMQLFNYQAAQRVLRRGVTVCDGYARLFKTLCDYAGVPSEIITGYARSDRGRIGSRFRSNHSWNAVYIDSAWHLLDVTWASGYITYQGGDFVKQYDGYYFMTPPRQFVQDHFPEDLKWTLLDNPPTIREFHNTPFKLGAMVRYKIKSFLPAKGLIEAAVGDTILFELETEDAVKQLFVSDATAFDSAGFYKGDSVQLKNNAFSIRGNKVYYPYVVLSDTVSWLNVAYNGDVIMRYKLNVTKEKGVKNEGLAATENNNP
ncbi:MAG: hypothetical protein ICV79_14985 [Flavisolibacter sp.]|nr:hypothetical protein [Flavisolibacter sp.]